MSIFEKLFGGGEKEGEVVKNEGEVAEEKMFGLPLKEVARCVNVFMANSHLSVGEEFVGAVMERANLSKDEVDSLVLAANNRNNPALGLSISVEQAYLEAIRVKLANVIKSMDVAEVVEKGDE